MKTWWNNSQKNKNKDDVTCSWWQFSFANSEGMDASGFALAARKACFEYAGWRMNSETGVDSSRFRWLPNCKLRPLGFNSGDLMSSALKKKKNKRKTFFLNLWMK